MSPEKPLSKTLFMSMVQCSKRFYLEKYFPSRKTSMDYITNPIINNGIILGKLGRELYKGGEDLSNNNTVWGMELVRRTRQRLRDKNPNKLFYEAAFTSPIRNLYFQSDVFIQSSMLNRLVEFKSGTYIKKPYYLLDVGFQTRVLLDLKYTKKLKIFIAHVNPNYIRKGDLDLEKLFIHQNVTESAHRIQTLILKKLNEIDSLLQKGAEPQVKVGSHCNIPYKCPFYDYCWSAIASKSIINVTGLKKSELDKLIQLDVKKITDVPEDIKLTDLQWKELKSSLKAQPIIKKQNIRKHLNLVQGKIAYMDFETINTPFPVFQNTWPYLQIPVQFCVLKYNRVSNQYIREEYIAAPNEDMRKEFVEKLIKVLHGINTIIVYNASFEKTRLAELMDTFPEYNVEIDRIIRKIFDLMTVFKEKWYWDPSFRGNYGLKTVLTILYPSLNYGNLIIKDGLQAMHAYNQLKTQYREERKATLKALRDYCHMDVLAMIKIHEFLKEKIN